MMTDRIFRFTLGLVLLVLLYLDQFQLVGLVVAFLLFEGVTNWRMCESICRRFGVNDNDACCTPVDSGHRARIPFDAERAFRLLISLVLVLAVFVYPKVLWWVPWFVAFAVLGAGISGVCPMLTSLRLAGFR